MNILKINSSANKNTSVSRNEVDSIVTKLSEKYPNAKVVNRDVAYSNLPFLTDEFLAAIFNPQELSAAQREATRISDQLIQEIVTSDVLVIGAPMYNFGIPASLKAYFDLIARAGKTFKYSDHGFPIGLLENKKAIVVITSGGVALDSPMDFSKNYISTFLGFLGIKDVDFIALDENKFKLEEKRKIAAQKLTSILNK